jgi:hypothetical protein
MKTPPIAFTEDNFCAVLNGTKTETRRLLTIKGETQDEVTQISKIERNEKGNYLFLGDELKPKYNIGDRPYLTEPTQNLAGADYTNKKLHIQYFWHSPESKWVTPTEQDLIKINNRKTGLYSKQNARFMLKSFARYWVEIVDVKLERLLDITAESAIAEGIPYVTPYSKKDVRVYKNYVTGEWTRHNPIDSYISEIEMLHGKAIANSNPWLWVYKFKFIGINNG